MTAETPTEPVAAKLPEHEVIPQGILGLQTVLHEEKHVAAFINSDHMPESADVHDGLDAVRQTLKDLPVGVSQSFSEITEPQIPEYMKEQFSKWSKKLSKDSYQKIVEQHQRGEKIDYTVMPDVTFQAWLVGGAEDEQLLNFVQWHTHRIEEIQKDPETMRLVEMSKDVFKYGVKGGIKAGFLVPESGVFLEEVDDIPLLVTDIVDASDQGEISAGYAINTPHHPKGEWGAYVTEPQTGEALEDEFYETAAHEMGHLYGDLGPDWIREALTEHFAQAVLFGQWETINPNDRSHRVNTYGPYRELVAVVAGDGTTELSKQLIQSLTRRYSAQDEEARINLDLEIDNNLVAMYGTEDVLDALSLQIQMAIDDAKLEDEKVSEHDIGMGRAAELIKEWSDPDARAKILQEYQEHKLVKIGLAAIAEEAKELDQYI